MRLIIAGGGTGGHLFPALAIAEAVKAADPQGSILFVGTHAGIEVRIVPNTGFPMRFITARGLRGTGILNRIRGTVELPLGVMQSFGIIWEFAPTLVLGVGGYASGPTLAAAVLMRVPTAIQEQNSVMGTTNRMLARFVDRIFTSWEDTDPAPPPGKTMLAGNPVRGDVLKTVSYGGSEDRESPNPKDEALSFPASIEGDKEPGRSNILIFGGSRGARSINRAVADNVDALAPLSARIRIVHQTGKDEAEEVRETYRNAGIKAEVREFIYEMGAAYEWADLVVCRAGASSLAEITALGKPAVVIPYPYAIGDHQSRNAAVLAARGAVRVVKDSELANGALVKHIRELVEDRHTLTRMAENSRTLGRPDAAATVAKELLRMERKGS